VPVVCFEKAKKCERALLPDHLCLLPASPACAFASFNRARLLLGLPSQLARPVCMCTMYDVTWQITFNDVVAYRSGHPLSFVLRLPYFNMSCVRNCERTLFDVPCICGRTLQYKAVIAVDETDPAGWNNLGNSVAGKLFAAVHHHHWRGYALSACCKGFKGGGKSA